MQYRHLLHFANGETKNRSMIKYGNRRVFSIAALALLLSPLWMVDKALANSSICEQTTRNMLAACKLDAREELSKTQANCLNIMDNTESAACIEQARTTRSEEIAQCNAQLAARTSACELLGEDRYDPDPLVNPNNTFINPDDIPTMYPPNPYVSLAEGHTYVLRDGPETIVVHVTGETRDFLGVACRVVVDAVMVAETDPVDGSLAYVPLEVTDDWFAQDTTGNVYYCGEQVRNYEDGVLNNLDGSFEAGKEFAKSGVLIKAFPAVGEAHRQEFALGEAEDIMVYQDLATAPGPEEGGDNPAFPCNANGGCLKTLGINPLEPEATEFKYFLPGTGFVLAVSLNDGKLTGGRESLTCVGDSLEILKDPSCRIENPDELMKELCEVSPDAFCEDKDDELVSTSS